jgi:hypothetical protein
MQENRLDILVFYLIGKVPFIFFENNSSLADLV